MVCLSRKFHFKVFKGCPAQVLLGPFLNSLTWADLLEISEIISSNKVLFSFDEIDMTDMNLLLNMMQGTFRP